MEQPLFILSLVSLIWKRKLVSGPIECHPNSSSFKCLRSFSFRLLPIPILTDHSLGKSRWIGTSLGGVTSIPLLQ